MIDKLNIAEASSPPDRWTLARDVLVLQIKLLADGARDFLLVPISLIAGAVSFFKPGAVAGTEFYDLLRIGRSTERWINLFGAVDRVHGPADEDAEAAFGNIDEIVDRLEAYLAEEHGDDSLTGQAKKRLDSAIEKLQHNLRQRNR